LALLALVLVLMLVAACATDEADNGDGDPCDEAALIEEDAKAAFCDTKTEYCCFCACYDDTDGKFDAALYYVDGVCECELLSGPQSEPCEDDVREMAQACVDDHISCTEVATQVAEAFCEDSLL
jgi:hypothetical protein